VHGSKPRVGPGPTTPVMIVPANEASREDLQATFGIRGYAAYSQCQRPKMRSWAEWHSLQVSGRMLRLEEQTHCG